LYDRESREEITTAPGSVSPKRTRAYSKRIFFIALALVGVSAFLILTGSNALSQKRASPHNAAKQDDVPQYTGSEPVLEWEKESVPEQSEMEEVPEMANYGPPPPDDDFIFNTAGQESMRAAAQQSSERQWLEHQRVAYLSKSMIQEWPIASGATNDAADAGSERQPAHGQPSALNNYLELLNSQSQKSSAQSSQGFFEKNLSAPGALSSTLQPQQAAYKIPAGTLIPCAIITGINSDLPGNITAQVSENVYDFVKPYVCLIPQGSRVFGTYSSSVDFGQRRVQVRWTSITYPNGASLNLEGMSGVDKRGYSGLHDKHHPHYGRMLTAALLTSALTILPDLVLDETSSSSGGGSTIIINTGRNRNGGKAELASAAADAVADMGKKVFEKNLNTPPTIQIRPGTRFNIQVNADILFNEAWS